MTRSSSRRRHGRPPPRSRQAPAPTAAAAGPARRRRPAAHRTGWWRLHWRAALVGPGVVVLLAGLGVAIALLQRPPAPDAGAVHRAILDRRTGAEVTFTGTLVDDPTNDGGHERMHVRDPLGDTLELDYNVTLGRIVPVRHGDTVEVHGQLYVDPGQAGVHCLHGQTSRGCPEPGWIQFAGTTYS